MRPLIEMLMLFSNGKVCTKFDRLHPMPQCFLLHTRLLPIDRVAELESEIDQLQSQLREQEQEATDAIAQWQDSSTMAENRCSELENQVSSLQEENKSLLEQSKVSIAATAEGTGEVNEQEITHAEPTDRDGDAMASFDSLKQALERKEDELRVAQETILGDAEVVQQWEGRSCALIDVW